MFSIKHIDHLVLRVIDIRKMMDFYIDTLGCTREKVNENAGLYQLRAGTSLIDLVPVDGAIGRTGGAAPKKEGRNLDHFCLSIEPFEADLLKAHLLEKGIIPGDVEQRYGAEGSGPSLYLRDPEGNVVELKGPPNAA
jgi:catechol 2,3-dioxygenase-like lactoylglutathione lyase family enzyme